MEAAFLVLTLASVLLLIAGLFSCGAYRDYCMMIHGGFFMGQKTVAFGGVCILGAHAVYNFGLLYAVFQGAI